MLPPIPSPPPISGADKVIDKLISETRRGRLQWSVSPQGNIVASWGKYNFILSAMDIPVPSTRMIKVPSEQDANPYGIELRRMLVLTVTCSQGGKEEYVFQLTDASGLESKMKELLLVVIDQSATRLEKAVRGFMDEFLG